MGKKRNRKAPIEQEVNLKQFLQKLLKYKWLLLSSIGLFVLLAGLYILLATPKYEVSTSLLIDPSGSNRALGESQYVEGGVSLIEIEKNLYNEIGIIKSFNLIEQTVKDLDFDVTYHSGSWFNQKDHYGYFPFQVTLDRSLPQLYGFPFEITVLPNNKYRISVKADDFMVSNPSNGSKHEVQRNFIFSKEYSFGDKVRHDYFNFTLNKPEYKINEADFKGSDLSFVVHDPELVTNGFLSKLDVNNIDIQASIFKLVSVGPEVNKEVDFLNRLTKNYIQNQLNSRDEIAASKEAFIREQLEVITDSLLKVELDMEVFKRDKKAVNLSATAANALQRTQSLQIDRAKYGLDIGFYRSLISYIENTRNSDEFVIPSATGINDPLITDNILELKRLYAERSKKKFYVTSNNEEMTILNGQINESTELLLSNLRNAIKASQYALGGVSTQISNYDEVISTLPMREKQLLSIERQSTLYQNLFNYLSQELAKTGIARAESTSDTRVLDEARMVGDSPVSPQKTLLMTLALTLGALLPMVWITWFAPQDVIEDVTQITAMCDIPVLASIAQQDTNSDDPEAEDTLWKVKESFRDLSANLKFYSSKKPAVLGITSIMPEEGKTFCAINLGITFAEAGMKTLIIDTDLRNPSLVESIKKVEGKGLSNYLRGDISSKKDIIYPHEKLSKLEFIPTSVVEDNIHELLSGDKMKSLILDLKENYDYIILDTPAVGLVSDFLLFWDLIDVNLFVVRRNVSKIGYLRDLENLSGGKKKKSGIVFNGALGKDFKYGYGKKYGVNKEEKLVKDSLSV